MIDDDFVPRDRWLESRRVTLLGRLAKVDAFQSHRILVFIDFEQYICTFYSFSLIMDSLKKPTLKIYSEGYVLQGISYSLVYFDHKGILICFALKVTIR